MSAQRTILFFLLSLLAWPSLLISQEIKIFKVSDFDLKGKVKTCFVLTDYGKEEYHFDKSGRLTKSVTRFNDFDHETTYYKYHNGELVERRVENYRDNDFDKATSLANFYTIDTTGNKKVTEKIVTYTKELLEQNVYRYDSIGKLTRIVRTDSDGRDITSVSYDTLDGKAQTTHRLNGELLKTIMTEERVTEDGASQRILENVSYLDGILNTKTEEVYNGDGKLTTKSDFTYDVSTERWIFQKQLNYSYGENGMLARMETKRRNALSSSDYIYQFDGTEANNWVKEIVTPENEYKTRRITYYKTPIDEEPK